LERRESLLAIFGFKQEKLATSLNKDFLIMSHCYKVGHCPPPTAECVGLEHLYINNINDYTSMQQNRNAAAN
jgi:hypothetical protein